MSRVALNGTTLELTKGDITKERVDAIVNAANSSLCGGGGVDGAIHSAGGSSIMAECRKLGSCKTGSAVITGGGALFARFVIHTVGPIYRGGSSGEANLLKSAYESSLNIAIERNLRTIAFPSISTGAYGYPIDEAAGIALRTIAEVVSRNIGRLDLVRFVLFSDNALASYEAALVSLKKDL